MRKEKIVSIICKAKANITKMTLMLLMAVSIVITVAGCDASPQNWPSESFTTKTWSASPKEKRYVYYNDLANSKKLNSLTKNEILSLLGEPDYASPDGRYFNYILKNAEKGEYSLNSIYFLEIDFDARGKVTEYFIRAD